MDGMSQCSWDAGPTSSASFGDIPGNLCSPTDDWPRPFRNLNHDDAWDHLAATSNLHSVKFDPTGRWRADALNFQPCAKTSSQDRYAVQQIHIQGRVWTLSAVFDGHLGSHTVEHVAHHMPIIVREHLELITQKHGDRVVPPPLIADMFAMAIRAFDDAIANDVLELFPGGLSSLSRLSDLQIQEVLDDQLSGGQNYTKARLCLYGTTALVALVDPDHRNLWLANLGDCQGLMVSETDQKAWNVEVLTRSHNGENPLEVQRVINEHPGEPECILDGRVLGAIAPFRCLGDTPFKQPPEFTRRILYNLYPGQHDTSPWEEFLMRNHTPPYISSTPEVTHYPLDPSPRAPRRYLILCSDGFTDICGTNQHVIVDRWARAAACSSSRELDEKSLALRLLWQALGNDPTSVSRVLTLNMDSPWLDDVSIVVQCL
ncbi:phosphatase 2C-like domain-containing protein [Suillus fuscotomentosus]|uniref:Phosphatase 2C-like domain-containing protein n=1 Tax=Suillus fuscotomentosus TaxID=1912939 RepID=A0AAD4E5Z9_9AGAM|nr:phosphatase 2C-like domain-containing protein [Suillus fuscotomentosus]KAG1899987.1 phosphatase 2C-like domain-containing protein [Suillus fuscotomentosus]